MFNGQTTIVDEPNNENQNSEKNENGNEDSHDKEEIATSDEEDQNELHPTSIYDYDQPIQNIYTYSNIGQKSNALNINFMDDEQPLQSIDSIVAEIESCKQQNYQNLYDPVKKEKYFEKNECNSSSSSICSVSSLSSTSSFQPKTKDSIEIFKLENQQQIFQKIYEDQINQSSSSSIISALEQKPHIQRKRGRKPKEENVDITNLQNKNRKKRPSSNLSNSSLSDLSSPSSSRKNSADLGSSFKLKKIGDKNSVILFLKINESV